MATVLLEEPFILDALFEVPDSNEGRGDTAPAGMFPKTPVVIDEDDTGADRDEEVDEPKSEEDVRGAEVSEDLDVDDFFSNMDDDASSELSRVVSPLITNTPFFGSNTPELECRFRSNSFHRCMA